MAPGRTPNGIAWRDDDTGARIPAVSACKADTLSALRKASDISHARQRRRATVTGRSGSSASTGTERVFGSFPDGGIAVVFGAGGGIGEALVDQLLARGNFEQVIGLSRTSSPAIDLLDEASLEHAASYAQAIGEIRLAIDATGFLHDELQRPEKGWRDLDGAKLARAFALNAIGPAIIMKHLLPRLPRSGKAVFATLSARVGSIGDNQLGGWYGYRASKTALNQLVRTAAIELCRRWPDAICVALHPGTVNTRLSSPFSKNGPEVLSPETAAGRLMKVADHLEPHQSGGFFDNRGETIPW